MTGGLLIAVAAGYASLLFALAWWGEGEGRARERMHRWSYPLALAVYCTSWTFFGAVGSANTEGWSYLPIYLGPILVYLFAARWLKRLVAAAQEDGASSISDFLGFRFSQSRGVAALVTVIALAGIIPYLALQLRSIGTTYAHITAAQDDPVAVTAITATILMIFAWLFGTRRFDVAGRSEGLLFAISAESIVKLIAFLSVSLFAGWLYLSAPTPMRAMGADAFADLFAPGRLGVDFLVLLLLAAAAIVCLPRQFHVGVVQAASPADVERARWPFIAYIAITAVLVLPITLASIGGMRGGAGDLAVLDLPLGAGADGLALLVFIGGFSAATAMVVVESIALSIMIANDLVVPLLLRSRRWTRIEDMGGVILAVRRGAIGLLLAVAVIFTLFIPANVRLASIGLIAFVAMAQLAPAVILAVARGNRNPAALMAGLSAGGLVWAYTLLLPPIMPAAFREAVRGGWADPHALLGFAGLDPITHGAIFSVGVNLLVHAAVAAQRLRPRISIGFVEAGRDMAVSDRETLIALVSRFVGDRAREELTDPAHPGGPVDRPTARRAERLLAGVVGAPSARALMASALSGERMSVRDVTRLLDEGGHSLQFSRDLLAATLENIDPGVSVIDRDLNLIAWNSRYLELFAYPEGTIRVGTPVATLIRHNALRGECGPGEVEAHVERRLAHMRRGARHSFERVRPDGRVLQTIGGPMPGGGYVMCFTDVTAEAEARAALEAARGELERRVEHRTAELSQVNRALAKATADKTRFLAAASHDLMQPLHAARLFAGALGRRIDVDGKPLLDRIERSIAAADELLRTLLDISKLDAGGIVPAPDRIALRPLLADLADTFAPLAAERGLTLRLAPGDAVVETDPVLLRSIVQNLLSNAVRYTAAGGVLVGVRRRGDMAEIIVADTGPGIAPADRERIFMEFERGVTGEDGGIGLGLAIVERSARLLGARIALVSTPGRGSRFSVSLPLARGPATPSRAEPETAASERPRRLRVLAVDNDARVCAAVTALLDALGHDSACFAGGEAALAVSGEWDAALLDLDLGAGMDGIALAAALRARQPGLPAALITADHSGRTERMAESHGLGLLPKPLDPDRLARWLASIAPQCAPPSGGSSPSARAASAA